jgi:hypothetical protein
MRFSSEEAFELRGTQDAIILDWPAARRILDQHGADVAEFYADHCSEDKPLATLRIDAGDLLGWLGY